MNSSVQNKVAVFKSKICIYPEDPPFNPPEIYPEYPYPLKATESKNYVYSAVRSTLELLGFDGENIGTKDWNPLGKIIEPGNTVLIKPNFIKESHSNGETPFSVITHGSVIRAVIDYSIIALKGEGKIIVADAPVVSATFEQILKATGLPDIIEFCKEQTSIEFCYYDLRKEVAEMKDNLIAGRSDLSGDPQSYFPIDLGQDSEFNEISEHYMKYRGSDYDMEETILHHNDKKNEYLLCGSALKADVVIHIPKLKTHQKSGVTLNLKGIIGINGDKNWIPHFRIGSPKDNGDEFPYTGKLRSLQSSIEDKLKQKLYKSGKLSLFLAGKLRKVHKSIIDNIDSAKIRSGAWSGNDTLWRSVVDLNKILIYADRNGVMKDTPQRKLFSVVDGIVAGDGNGPLSPRIRREGIMLAGSNWLAVDLCATRLMGFDYDKIPMLKRALSLSRWQLMDFGVDQIKLLTNEKAFKNAFIDREGRYLDFMPSPGWMKTLQ